MILVSESTNNIPEIAASSIIRTATLTITTSKDWLGRALSIFKCRILTRRTTDKTVTLQGLDANYNDLNAASYTVSDNAGNLWYLIDTNVNKQVETTNEPKIAPATSMYVVKSNPPAWIKEKIKTATFNANNAKYATHDATYKVGTFEVSILICLQWNYKTSNTR